MAKKGFLESIKVPSPCNANWEDMLGDDRKRFCLSCKKDVFNLAAMSRTEATSFVSKNEGKACIRYGRMTDGTVLTTYRKPTNITRNRTAVAAGVIAASLTFATVAYSQGEPVIPAKDGKTSAAKSQTKTSQISFTISDVTGAVIPAAIVVLKNKESGNSFTASTDQDGVAKFESLPHGFYGLEVSAPYFEPRRETLLIKEQTEPNMKLRLNAGSAAVGVFIIDWSNIPLFQALKQKDDEVVKKIIRSGFNVNTKDNDGKTALHYAVANGNLEIINLLLNRGAKINAKAKDKRTPIWMLETDDENLVMTILRLLISKGADVNHQNDEGESLLMLAAADDSLEGVKIFLNAGANPNLKDKDGETAIEKTSSDEIKQLLIKHGAKPPK